MRKTLKIIFIVDGIIAIIFGIFSLLFPMKTYGSILAIPNGHESLFFSILSSLSLFYTVIGITCLIGSKSNYPINLLIALLMLMRHIFEGIIKIGDIGKTWLIGNPYQDIIIHSIFIGAYLIGIVFAYKNAPIRNN